MAALTQEEYINRCKEKFGDKFDYSNTKYVNKRTKVTVICQIHGEFETNPLQFLNFSFGCPECGKEYAAKWRQGDKETFVNKVKAKFGDVYSFPDDDYIDNKKKVHVHCNICGRDFMKRPNDILTSPNGGCPHYRIKEKEKMDFGTFMRKANLIHSGKYKYVMFAGEKCVDEKVTIICPIHGKFEMTIKNHLKGKGCKNDSAIKSEEQINKEREEFIKKSNEMYGNELIINFDEYKGPSDKITMKCPKCGYTFKRSPRVHLANHIVCGKCNAKIYGAKRTKTTEEFIKEAKEKYGDEYSYDKTIYKKSDLKVIIKHNTCGRYFKIGPTSFLQGNGCPYHYRNHSKGEEELANFIKEILPNVEVLTNDRNALDGEELDIYIPSMKFAIEYDGIFWHNENNKGINYHIEKTEKCEKIGIRLIHVFEDEWLYKKDIWKSVFKNMLSDNDKTIYARKCDIKEINYKDSKVFLDENHLQGNCMSSTRYGLFYKNELLAIMTFGKSRTFTNIEKPQYELLRFAVKMNYSIIGGASKLLSKFINDYNPESIVSYADRRWSVGNLYNKLGFKLYNKSRPNYYYVVDYKRVYRFNMRKSVLVKKYGCPNDMTEREFCKSQKWYRIYDCGCLCYKWENNNV